MCEVLKLSIKTELFRSFSVLENVFVFCVFLKVLFFTQVTFNICYKFPFDVSISLLNLLTSLAICSSSRISFSMFEMDVIIVE